MFGWTGKTLIIDLFDGSFSEKELPPSFCKEWLGGKGFNAGLDTVFPENMDAEKESIRLAVGPFVGTPILGGSAWCIDGKHPFTEEPISAFGTGNWGIALKYSGYDQIVVKRAASLPSILVVGEKECLIETVTQDMAKKAFTQSMKERFGPYTEILLNGDRSIEGRGFVGGNAEDIGLLLKQRNIKAIIATGQKSIPLANPALVLKSSQQVIRNWKESLLPTGQNGCAVCHGRCINLSDNVGGNDPEMLNLWLALGCCPQFMQSGFGLSINEIISYIEGVTGQYYSVEDLLGVARKIEKASRGLSGEARRLE